MNRYAPQESNPNTVLVVFLVLFVLTSIGLGVWAFLSFQDLQKAQDDMKKLDKEKVAPVLEAKRYYAFVEFEMRAAVGDTLSPDEMNDWQNMREEFLGAASKIGENEKTPSRKDLINLIAVMKADLKSSVDDKKYATTYKALIEKLASERKSAMAAATKAANDAASSSRDDQLHGNKIKEGFAKMSDQIKAESSLKLDAFKQRTDSWNQLFEENKRLAQQIKELQALNQKDKDDAQITRQNLEFQVDQLKQTLGIQKTDKQDIADKSKALAALRSDSSKHALILDISRGKPMWDQAFGSIKSVKDRKVTINLGYDDGVRTGLTFNVFAPGKTRDSPYPSKEMKGTIEVLRNIQKHTAECLITDQFDPKDNRIAEDDLLFNMFWGTHVVVAGQVNWFGLIGARAEDAANQVRNLDQFMQLLLKQGVIVDGYVDLTDGVLKGGLTPRTRFLIRGQDLYQPKFGVKTEADKGEADDKAAADPMPKEDNVKTKFEEFTQNRIKKVNASIQSIRTRAIEDGVFIINAENFAHVTGIQKWRATNGPEAIGWRPSLPASGD